MNAARIEQVIAMSSMVETFSVLVVSEWVPHCQFSSCTQPTSVLSMEVALLCRSFAHESSMQPLLDFYLLLLL